METQPNFTPNKWIPSVEVRRWLFRVLVAALTVAAAYKLIESDFLPLWIELAGELLAIGALSLAERNVPRHS